jgi:serine protease AprX
MKPTLLPALTLAVALVLLTSLVPQDSAWVAAGASPLPDRQLPVDTPVWEALRTSGRAAVLIVLREQGDLSAADVLSSRQARGRYVYETLHDVAEKSQRSLRLLLDGQGIAYRPFYIVNAIQLQVDEALVLALAARPDVERIVFNPWVQGIPTPEAAGVVPATSLVTGIEPNLLRVNADDAWALGYTGEGVVVAGQDTGYDAEHPALRDQYRGWDGAVANHDYSWHDAIHQDVPGTAPGNPCGFDAPQPCDDHGHGTHTMGTMVGDDGLGHQIGVAPDARWIGCRNMEQGVGSPATYLECFEFFLAPYPVGGTPEQGDPALAPYVVNNSWSCPPDEGCDPAILEGAVDALRQAGIAVVVSAGNYGFGGCETVLYPPAIYPASLNVGAFDHTNDRIAAFSSRGPVTYGDQTYLGPEITAPGVSIYSSLPGGAFGYRGGTSMAAPHVTGGIAILISAAPSLAGDVDAIERVLTLTAEPRLTAEGCGGDGPEEVPNNVWGWGILDLLDAVGQVTSGSLQGSVTDAENGEPVANARLAVRLSLWSQVGDEILTDALGQYALRLPAGSYHLEASAPCYAPQSVPVVEVISGSVTIQDVALVPRLCTYLPLVAGP